MSKRIIYGLIVGGLAALGVFIGQSLEGGFDFSDWKGPLGAFIGGGIGGYLVWKKHIK